MNIKCIIIDDEPLAVSIIEKYLKEFQDFEILSTFSNPVEAIERIEMKDVDVVFLDINMPKMKGLDFVRNLIYKPNIVITTAYREFAAESYDLDILDYLIKPIPFERFLKTISKIKQQINLQRGFNPDEDMNPDSYIFLKVDKKMVKINFDDILYIESLKDYIKVFTSAGNYVAHKSISSITDELPSKKFLRIHRSYTISIDRVSYVEGNMVDVASKRLPIGRKYIAIARKVILHQDVE
ncbi:MAG: response regulator transcription factor [Flavobacteriaceae bacterium]|nr:response regulator transcription factor [Flavobacteriaceae bacterium]